jgi:hypothetical protein
MSHAYQPNDEVPHRGQGPRGRVQTVGRVFIAFASMVTSHPAYVRGASDLA